MAAKSPLLVDVLSQPVAAKSLCQLVADVLLLVAATLLPLADQSHSVCSRSFSTATRVLVTADVLRCASPLVAAKLLLPAAATDPIRLETGVANHVVPVSSVEQPD